MNINIFRPLYDFLGLPYVGPYFTMLILSFFIAFPLTAFLAPRFSLRGARLLTLTAVAIVASLAGSKLFHLLFDGQWSRYATIYREQGFVPFLAVAVNPISAGQVFYGGFIVAYLVSYLFIRRVWREPTGRYGDIAAFPVALGIALARIGCFFAGCCFGLPSKAFGASFPAYTPAAAELYAQGITDSFMEETPPLIPTQLIESVAAFGIFFYLCWRLRDAAKLPAGFFLTRFLVLYAVFRFLIEFLRADLRGGFLFLSTAQWISIGLLAVLWIVRRRSRGLTGLTALTALLLVASPLMALPPEKQLQHYVAQHWSVREGLPHNTVADIARTPDGLWWLASPAGLVRFDGARATVFGKDRIPGLDDSRFTRLAVGGDGALWAGTEGGDIVRLRKGVFTRFAPPVGVPRGPVFSLVALSDGAWASVGGAAIRVTEGAAPAQSSPLGHVADILLAADARGAVVAAAGNEMAPLGAERSERLTFSRLVGTALSALAFAPDGALWVGTAAGEIIRFDGPTDTTGRPVRKPDGMAITAFAFDDAVVWAGTQGAGLLRVRDGVVGSFAERHGLRGQMVRALHRDADGALWVGTEEGLSRFSDGAATTYTTVDGLSSNLVYAILEDNDGALWVGTRGGGLNRFADGRFTALTTKDGLPSDLIGALALDSDGSVWVGTAGGLSAVRRGRVTEPYTTDDGLAQNLVGAILRDRDDRLWVGTVGGAVNRLQNNKKFRSYLPPRPPLTTLVSQIYEDRSGRLWIASQFGLGLFSDGYLKIFDAAEGLVGRAALAIAEDGDMNLWVGTHRGGLNLYRNGRFSALTALNGLPVEDVYAVLIDDDDRLWFSTDAGIWYAPRLALMAYLEKRGPKPPLGMVGLTDGMKTLECTGGVQPAAIRSRSGLFYFPTLKGLVAIDPRKVPRPDEMPRAYVAGLTAGERTVLPGGDIVLPLGTTAVSIDVGTIAASRTGTAQFRYRLNGGDGRWREGSDTTVRYTELAPGTYEFEVRARLKGDAWGPAGRVAFTIAGERPFPFVAVMIVTILASFFIGVVAMIIRKRRKKRDVPPPPAGPTPGPGPEKRVEMDPVEQEGVDTTAGEDIFLTHEEEIPDPPPVVDPGDRPRQRYERSRLDDDTAGRLVAMILDHLDKEKPYKDPDITLARLADRIGLTPHMLSQLLNDRLNKNFNHFINDYRIDEVKKLLDTPSNRDKLLAIAYDAGFRSKTTFNTMFKRSTGKTPSEYRRSLDGGEIVDSDDMPE
ncbi:MAG TPA: two-component regulator propeller domain-containing protein [bacterium]|nr:two-component regulator propeller domain-containing protein [bacterium]